AGMSSAIGAYPIDAALGTLSSNDYRFEFATGALTITKAPLTIAAADKTRLYGDGNPPPTGTLTGLKNGDGVTAAYSIAATAASDVGSYPITPAAVDSAPSTLGNYDLTLVSGSLSVTQAPLTITAADKTKVYGDGNPTLTGTIAGLKNNDGITAAYSTAATAASGVGSYAITPAAVDETPAKLGNYDLTLVGGSLSITRAPLDVTADA